MPYTEMGPTGPFSGVPQKVDKSCHEGFFQWCEPETYTNNPVITTERMWQNTQLKTQWKEKVVTEKLYIVWYDSGIYWTYLQQTLTEHVKNKLFFFFWGVKTCKVPLTPAKSGIVGIHHNETTVKDIT